MTGMMHEGNFVGKWTSYFKNGQKSEETLYDSTKSVVKSAWDILGNQIVTNGTGLYKSFSNDSIVLISGQLENGDKVGVWKTFHPNGELSMEGKYENDTKIINAWDIYKRQMIENGNGFYTSYYTDGIKVYENGEVKNGVREGYWKAYHEATDNLFKETNYRG